MLSFPQINLQIDLENNTNKHQLTAIDEKYKTTQKMHRYSLAIIYGIPLFTMRVCLIPSFYHAINFHGNLFYAALP